MSIAVEGSDRVPSGGRLRILAADSPFARNDFDHPHRLTIDGGRCPQAMVP